MGWVIHKSLHYAGRKSAGICLRKSGFCSMGILVWEALGKPERIVLLIDVERCAIALRSAKDNDQKSRSVTNCNSDKTKSIYLKSVFNFLELDPDSHFVKMEKEGDLLVFDLSDIPKKKGFQGSQ